MTRIAFISDIHANLEALQAVMEDIKKQGADMTICLGDIVGYGPDPQACVDIIRENEIQTVMGNHDEYVTLLMDPRVDRLREEVRSSVEWTQSRLTMDSLTWLSKLPYAMEADEFSITHGSYEEGNHFAYCKDEETFERNFEGQTCQLAFCGHSHRPLIGVRRDDGKVFVDYIREGSVPSMGKVMVNVGSVGQPRDENPRACVVYYDYESRDIKLSRVEYDVKTTMQKILKSPLAERFAKRLEVGK